MPKENCLERMTCPKCGHEDSFVVAYDAVILVNNARMANQLSGTLEEDSNCVCRKCRHIGTVKSFTESEPPQKEKVT